ncbi:fructoselysine 6-kinase [Aquamicrobium sp. LC103]|nr:fructoselysine 6-kinase [Aquamicrobium sp. LC103]
MERKPRIAAVGDNCIDVLLPPIDRRLVGGNALNVAVQLARLGADAFYFGAVGRDEQGDLVASALRANGVNSSHLVRRSAPTSHTIISVDAAGDRHMDHEDFGACDGYAPTGAAIDALLTMDHVHIGWLNDGGALRRRLAKAGVSVSQDISVNSQPRHLGVEGLAIVFASLEGSHDQVEAEARCLLSKGARNAVLTRGSAGSSIFFSKNAFERSAEKITPLDTTGAGDSFAAGFLYAIFTGKTSRQAADDAAVLASRTCLHLGGFPQ